MRRVSDDDEGSYICVGSLVVEFLSIFEDSDQLATQYKET